MTTTRRRDFLRTAAAGLAGGAVGAGCDRTHPADAGSAPAVIGKKIEWDMVTTWSPHFPVLGEGADLLGRWIGEMSGGRLKIKVHGGGEIVPALESFNTVRQGVNAQMGHGASYYWAGKLPVSQFFAAVPFGMNAQQMNAWLYGGGGIKLWEEAYADFGLVPMPAGNTGVQMGGWFNKRIDAISDVKGLKMRMPGLGGKVIGKAGGAAILSPGAEIYTNLERGVIDATEWIGPYHDFIMGFHKIAKYYYYPGWHEPGTTLELIVNKKALEALPADLQAIVRTAAAKLNVWMISEFEAKNVDYLQKIAGLESVKILPFPTDVLAGFRKFTDEVLDEVTAQDEASRKVYAHFDAFRKKVGVWAKISEGSYHSLITG